MKYIFLLVFSSSLVNSVLAFEQYYPDVSNMDASLLTQDVYPDTSRLTNVYGDSLYIRYPKFGAVPSFGSGTPSFVKILVPPGTSSVGANGESGSFTDQFFSTFSYNVTPEQQAQCVSSNCLGNAMGRVTGRLSATLYSGATLSEPRYVSLALLNNNAGFSLSTFIVEMKIDNKELYNAWRSARKWAGGESKGCPKESQSCPNDGIGESISAFTFTAKSESDSRGSVTCNNTACQTSAAANTAISLQATEKSGFVFSEWQCTGSSPVDSKSKSTTVTVTANTDCKAIFNSASSGSSSSSVEYALPDFPGIPKADVKLSARVDELPNGGFSWLNLSDANAITAALKDYGNLPTGSSLTVNAAIAPSESVNAMDVYAVVLLSGAGKPDIFKQKILSKASFDFTNENEWQQILQDFSNFRPYKTVSNAKAFSNIQPYSFIVGAGEVTLPKGYSNVMFAIGYQANGVLRATLSGVLPVAGIQYTPISLANVTYKLPSELTEPSVDNCSLFDDNTNQQITQGVSKSSIEIPQADGTSKTVDRCVITTSNIPATTSFVRLTYTKSGQTPTFAKYFEIKR